MVHREGRESPPQLRGLAPAKTTAQHCSLAALPGPQGAQQGGTAAITGWLSQGARGQHEREPLPRWELPEVADGSTGLPLTFALQVNNEYIFRIPVVSTIAGDILMLTHFHYLPEIQMSLGILCFI